MERKREVINKKDVVVIFGLFLSCNGNSLHVVLVYISFEFTPMPSCIRVDPGREWITETQASSFDQNATVYISPLGQHSHHGSFTHDEKLICLNEGFKCEEIHLQLMNMFQICNCLLFALLVTFLPRWGGRGEGERENYFISSTLRATVNLLRYQGGSCWSCSYQNLIEGVIIAADTAR